jgi:hypothetical protein
MESRDEVRDPRISPYSCNIDESVLIIVKCNTACMLWMQSNTDVGTTEA